MEPLSQKMTSKSVKVWAARLSRVSCRCSELFRQFMMTETTGASDMGT